MKIEHVYRPTVDVARPEESVQAIAQRMTQRNVGMLVVVDEERRPVGIVTDRDLVTRVLAARRDAVELTAADVMTERPTTVTAHGAADVSLILMADRGFRRIPVVDANGALAGVLSIDDVVRSIAAELSRVSRVLAVQTPERAAED